jgi:hypothetical protein
MANPRAISASPALIRSTGKNCSQSNLISKTSTGSPSSAWAEFSSVVLSVEHLAITVNGTKDPVVGGQDYDIGRVDRKGFRKPSD